MSDFRKILLTAALLAMLTGCMGGGSVKIPRDHYYRLPAVTATALPAPVLPGSLELSAVQASGMLHERAILFVREQQPLEVSPYHYYYWVNTPASLLQQHLLDYLRQKNLATAQHRYRADTPADFRLETELLHFERQLRANTSEARVELELILRDNRNQRILLRKRYRQRSEASSPAMADTVSAFGQALTVIYRQFAKDVAALDV